LVQLAKVQEEEARAAQAAEDARASDALDAVQAQISLLRHQISIEERSLEALDKIAAKFDALATGVLSVSQAVAQYNSVSGSRIKIPSFADGGMHSGGLALVGEEGPELVNMGPSRVHTTADTADMFSRSGDDEAVKAELVKQNEYLRELVKISHKQERTLKEIELQGEVI